MNKYLKISLAAAAGAAAGYLYYYLWGCQGACPMTSNWHIPTLYGLFAGILLTYPFNKKKTPKDR